MRMRCLLALLLSAAWFASVVAAVSPPIPPCIRHRDDMVKHVRKAQDRGPTANWATIRGGVAISSRRAAIAASVARRRRKETNQFMLANAVIYVGLFSAMVKWGVMNLVLALNASVFCGWQVLLLGEAYFERLLGDARLDHFMIRHFIRPLSRKKLRASPFSAFGSVFSHIRYGHIAANLDAFLTYDLDADKVLGNMRFAHLYLISSLCSFVFSCVWHECGMTSSHATGLGSLGASGAINEVMSWVCLQTWNRG
jgi:membrane associated rhomboid family serine protease